MQVVSERQKLYGGFGTAFSLAIEFVAVPMIFGFIGHLIDGRAGTGTLFTVILGIFGVVGMFVSAFYRYVEAMKAEEAKKPWAK
jgi:F0F1-type ATP synthase assembly protein I